MTPYRSSREAAEVARPDVGLVADMVRQFADPYAFLRELAQNGIDAGATKIAVRIARDAEGVVTTSLEDDGCGMTLEIIEGQLLTLFSSTKEGDSTKIGKYGVGFVSVLAIDPDEVEIDTRRDGRAWLVRLFRDHRYEIHEAPPRPGTGTIVRLLGRMDADMFATHVRRAEESLRRWCRHASLPITLFARDHGVKAEPVEARIDRPLSVRGSIDVSASIDGEVFAAALSAGELYLRKPAGPEIGPLEQQGTFAGFYNRGLTLLETTTAVHPSLGGVRIKVVSSSLKHTLSRDDVRRDAAFDRSVERARRVVSGPLREALLRAIEAAARGPWSDGGGARYAALLEAAIRPPMEIPAREITFPLAHPIEGRRTIVGPRAPLLATEPDGITEALAREGRHVVLVVHPSVADNVRVCFPKLVVEDVRSAYLLVEEIAIEGPDAALCDLVRRALAAAGEEVTKVGMCSLHGAAGPRSAVAIPDDEPGPKLHSAREIEGFWRRWSSRHRLLLHVDAPVVRSARAIAAGDRSPAEVAAAAAILARRLLVEGRGPIEPRDADRLLGVSDGAALGEAR